MFILDVKKFHLNLEITKPPLTFSISGSPPKNEPPTKCAKTTRKVSITFTSFTSRVSPSCHGCPSRAIFPPGPCHWPQHQALAHSGRSGFEVPSCGVVGGCRFGQVVEWLKMLQDTFEWWYSFSDMELYGTLFMRVLEFYRPIASYILYIESYRPRRPKH